MLKKKIGKCIKCGKVRELNGHGYCFSCFLLWIGLEGLTNDF